MTTANFLPATLGGSSPSAATKSRSLVAACLTHALHDGYTDGLYAFLPGWQAQFGLSYAALGMVRALYYGTMGGLQIPADKALRGMSARAALIVSTVVAAMGFFIMALPFGFAGLCVGLVVAGIGSSIQHPRGSMLVSDSYGKASRRPLGIYNFSGDLGKAALPAFVAVLLPILAWRPVLGLMGVLGIALAVALVSLAPAAHATTNATGEAASGRGRGGFRILATIGALDTATRMGYLLFLPFLIHGRGGGSPTVGMALALLFIGGAFGKATCGWLGERLGVVSAVMLTEAATALLIAATLFTPLTPTLILLPLRNRPGACRRRHGAGLRDLLYERHWLWRNRANPLRRNCRSQQPEFRRAGLGGDRRPDRSACIGAPAPSAHRQRGIGLRGDRL